jgi:hypothetical protein
MNASVGQAAAEPVHVSKTSQTPAEALHTVPAALNHILLGKLLMLRVHVSCGHHKYLLMPRQTVPAAKLRQQGMLPKFHYMFLKGHKLQLKHDKLCLQQLIHQKGRLLLILYTFLVDHKYRQMLGILFLLK